jgi:hypothetical protein
MLPPPLHSFACSLVHSELSELGLQSRLQIHVAQMHYCSHYSVVYTYHPPPTPTPTRLQVTAPTWACDAAVVGWLRDTLGLPLAWLHTAQVGELGARRHTSQSTADKDTPVTLLLCVCFLGGGRDATRGHFHR